MSIKQAGTDSHQTDRSEQELRSVNNELQPVTVNYYRLLLWFWEEVPYMPGYKSEYGSTFLAIVDSINRNADRDTWRETAVDYDRLINKIKCSKRLYYEGLRWLRTNNLLAYTPGRNEHSMARFHIGAVIRSEVQKRTSTGTSTDKVEVQKRTSSGTSTSTSTAPINKDIPNTYIPDTNSLPVVPTFDAFWEAYDKKLDKVKSVKCWNKLTDKDKFNIMTVVPAYVLATSGDRYQYRKHPSTFLNQESWKDEDIGKAHNKSAQQAPNKTTSAPRPVHQTDIR